MVLLSLLAYAREDFAGPRHKVLKFRTASAHLPVRFGKVR